MGTRPAARSAGNYFLVPLHCFGSTSTISRFDERFLDGQYHVVSFVFVFLLMVPRAQPFVKVGSLPSVPYGVGANAKK